MQAQKVLQHRLRRFAFAFDSALLLTVWAFTHFFGFDWRVQWILTSPMNVSKLIWILHFERVVKIVRKKRVNVSVSMMVLNVLRNLLWYSNYSSVVWNYLNPAYDKLELTDFFPINFAEIVNGNDVKPFECFIGLIKFFRNDFTLLNFIRTAERRVNKAFTIWKSQSTIMERITWFNLD